MESPVDSELTALFVVLNPVDSEPTELDIDVDSDVTLLLVVLNPVDSELTALDVDVDNDATLLFVVDNPVDKLPTARLVAFNCEPLTASVLVALTRPAATLVIWRSAPGAPTLTTLVGVAPA